MRGFLMVASLLGGFGLGTWLFFKYLYPFEKGTTKPPEGGHRVYSALDYEEWRLKAA